MIERQLKTQREFTDLRFARDFPDKENIKYSFEYYNYLGKDYDYIVACDLADFLDKEIDDITEEEIEEASKCDDFFEWLKENHKLGEREDL